MGAPSSRTFPNKPRSQRHRVSHEGVPAMRRQHSGHATARLLSPKSQAAQNPVNVRRCDVSRPTPRSRPSPAFFGENIGLVFAPHNAGHAAIPLDSYARTIRRSGPDYRSTNVHQVMQGVPRQTSAPAPTPVQVPSYGPSPNDGVDILDVDRVLHPNPRSPSRLKRVAAQADNGKATAIPCSIRDQSSDGVQGALYSGNGAASPSGPSTPKKNLNNSFAPSRAAPQQASPKPEYQWTDAALAASPSKKQPRGYRTLQKVPREMQESTAEMTFPDNQKMTPEELRELRRAVRPFIGTQYAPPGVSSRAMYAVTARTARQGPYKNPPQDQMASEGVSRLLDPPTRPSPRRNAAAARRMHSSPSWAPLDRREDEGFQPRRSPVKRMYPSHKQHSDHIKPLWNGRQSSAIDQVRPATVQSPSRAKRLSDTFGLDPQRSIIADHSAQDRANPQKQLFTRPQSHRGRVQASREMQSSGYAATLGISAPYNGSMVDSHKALRSRRVADMCGGLNLSFGYEPKGMWSDKIISAY